MMFEYDSWNRVQRIVYPDSEVVSYSYDLGGQLYSVSAFKNNVSSSLINSILYDEFGHRTQVNFGNGVTTNYSYDILQRLNTLQTYSNNASLQKISYSFDLEDNITRVENTASGANGLGGGYTFDYQYDNLYRLTSSTGTFAPNGASYGLEMDFTPAGRVCRKFQDYTGTGNVYAYSPNNKQHAVRRIYNGLTNELSNLRWDNNGNLAQQTVYSLNNNVPTFLNMRMLFWDEDDRLNLVAGDGYLSYYAYGYDGNRTIKMTGNAAIDQTGTLLNSTNLENITIYPSEYLTVTQAEYTKYYYAGGNRIASKIGTGGFGKMQRLCTLDQSLTYNANTLLNFVLYQIANVTNQPNDEYPVDVCAGYNVSNELLHSPLPDFYISQTNLNFTQNNLLQQFRQNLTNSVEPVYYFHSDHLGSASWITSGTGGAVQHLLYLPFGEHFVNERSTAYDERFTFTGKERDAETGYYYHGARFNSSDWGFMSVDPMSDKYPSLSPYAYCAWNPVNVVDPDGNDGVKIIDKQTHSITVSATYYVTSQPTQGIPNTSYSPSEIESMQKDINNTLNSQGFTYEIDGEKYDVCFDLSFVEAGEAWKAEIAAEEDLIGNWLSVLPESAKNIFPVKDNGDGTETHVGGVTENNKKIIMNSKYDNMRRRIHEIFHTLFFNNDNAKSGIGNYVPGVDMPNQSDINKLLSNPQLPEKIEEP